MKYKVGDKVRIIDHRGFGWSLHGGMDKYMNTVLTIQNADGMFYYMEECPKWAWVDSDIVEKVSEVNMTKKELKSKVEELEKELAKFKKELDEKDKSPYAKRTLLECYYYVDGACDACVSVDDNHSADDRRYKNANYFSDESFAKKVAAEQTLTNLLRKYTYEHGWSDDLWDDKDTPKFCVYYNELSKQMTLDYWFSNKYLGVIYFVDAKTASNAIQEVIIPFVKEHPELGYKLKD